MDINRTTTQIKLSWLFDKRENGENKRFNNKIKTAKTKKKS